MKRVSPQRRFASFRPQLEVLESRLTMSASAATPGILPPQSNPFGASYAEWSAKWWQWCYSLQANHHPLTDTADVSTGQSGKVWFLGASFVSTTNPNNPSETDAFAIRNAKVPTGVALFFPILNAEQSTLEAPGETDAQLRADAKSFQDPASDMTATIDGKVVFAQTASQQPYVGPYRVVSPAFNFKLPPDPTVIGLFGIPNTGGKSGRSVADGVYLMAEPLSAGQHTIHFKGDLPLFNFFVDITYNLDVVPAGHYHPPAASCAGLQGSQAVVAALPTAGSQQTAPVVVSAAASSDQPTTPFRLPVAPLTGQVGANAVSQPAAKPLVSTTDALDSAFADLWDA